MKKEEALGLVLRQEPDPSNLRERSAREIYGGWLFELERTEGEWGQSSPFRIVDDAAGEVVHVTPKCFVEDFTAAFEACRRAEEEQGADRAEQLQHRLLYDAEERWQSRADQRSRQRAEAFLELVGLEPDRNGLLTWLATQTTAADLDVLASADYGERATENTRALRRVLDAQSIPTPLDVEGSWLEEVCSLTKWGIKRDEVGLAGTLACTIEILAAAPGEPLDEHTITMSSSVAGLVQSVQDLDASARALAAGMLSDACLRYGEEDHDDLFCALGIATLLERIEKPVADVLIQWESEAAEADHALGASGRSADWLFRLTHHTSMKLIWRERILAVQGDGAATLRPLVEEWVWPSDDV